jgi:putative flippase GtrA
MGGPHLPPAGVLGRSALVGVAATLVDLVALAAATGAGVASLVANVPALLLGLLVQFVGNKSWAFRDASPRVARQLALFSIVEVAALAFNAALFHLAVLWLDSPPLLTRVVVSAGVYFGFSLRIWRHIFVPGAEAGR